MSLSGIDQLQIMMWFLLRGCCIRDFDTNQIIMMGDTHNTYDNNQMYIASWGYRRDCTGHHIDVADGKVHLQHHILTVLVLLLVFKNMKYSYTQIVLHCIDTHFLVTVV